MVSKKRVIRQKIGQVFLKLGMVTKENLQEALEYSGEWGKKLGVSLVELGYLTEEELAKGLSSHFSVEKIIVSEIKIPIHILGTVSVEVVKKYHILPLYYKGEKLVFATSDPSNFEMIQNLEFITGNRVALVVATEAEIQHAIDHYYLGKPKKSVTKKEMQKKVSSREKLFDTIKDCLRHEVITKDELISELIDL